MFCTGKYTVHQKRDGKIISSLTSKNIVVNEGIDRLLNLFFDVSGDTFPSFTYIGIYSNSYIPNPADNAATFYTSSYANEVSSYTEPGRQVFRIDPISGFTVTNTVIPAVFNFTGNATVRGMFLDTVSGNFATYGTLISASLLPSTISIVAGDQIIAHYSFTLTAS